MAITGDNVRLFFRGASVVYGVAGALATVATVSTLGPAVIPLGGLMLLVGTAGFVDSFKGKDADFDMRAKNIQTILDVSKRAVGNMLTPASPKNPAAAHRKDGPDNVNRPKRQHRADLSGGPDGVNLNIASINEQLSNKYSKIAYSNQPWSRDGSGNDQKPQINVPPHIVDRPSKTPPPKKNPLNASTM